MEHDDLSKLTFDQDDKLDRRKYAVHLTNFLLDSENNQNVICVNSSWGAGKTWFVHMFINMLKSNDEYVQAIIPVYYNAWENDDFDNAFVPLIGEINNQLFNKVKRINKVKVKKAAGAILKDITINAIKKVSADLVNPEEVLKSINEKELFEQYVSDYGKYKRAKINFIEAMSSFTFKANKKVFIFIDELDRCRPTFAIETLERIKHYFSIKGVYFILLLDKQQLSHSIKVLYGNDCDTTGYLLKFFDIEYGIPEVENKAYFGLRIRSNRRFEQAIKGLIPFFNLSLRECDKLVIWTKILVANVPSLIEFASDEAEYLFAYLLLLKLKLSDVFHKIFDKYQKKDLKYSTMPHSYEIDDYVSKITGTKIINLFCTIHKIAGTDPISINRENELYNNEKYKSLILEMNKSMSMLEHIDAN